LLQKCSKTLSSCCRDCQLRDFTSDGQIMSVLWCEMLLFITPHIAIIPELDHPLEDLFSISLGFRVNVSFFYGMLLSLGFRVNVSIF